VELLGDGALGVSEAPRFSGLSRATLCRELQSGRLAFKKPAAGP
jgi:hypothetical protein